MNENVKCKNCKFHWQSEPRSDLTRHHECHIDPPKAQLFPGQNGAVFMSVWPAISAEDHWCGKFEPNMSLVN